MVARRQALLKEFRGKTGNVCGDKAYSCRENAGMVTKRSGRPFLMPKKNASFRARGVKPGRT